MKISTISVIALLLFISQLLLSCAKNDSNNRGETRLQIFLGDDPGDYEEVIIDVRDVQVNLTGDGDEGWQSLSGVNTGSYDLLRLVNDNDTLLADAAIPSGRIRQLRLILGEENFVKINGVMIRLNKPADQQTGLTLAIQQDVLHDIVYKILLDFDVARSIVASGNGDYNLKPAIRTVFESVGGSIRGWVNPGNFKTGVYALQGIDTIAGSFTGDDGGYSIKGIAQGLYTLYFNSSDSVYRDSVITNIPVVNREISFVDTMFLQP